MGWGCGGVGWSCDEQSTGWLFVVEGPLERWVGAVVGWVGPVRKSRQVGYSQVVKGPVVWWAEYAGYGLEG